MDPYKSQQHPPSAKRGGGDPISWKTQTEKDAESGVTEGPKIWGAQQG